jgi:hypothetical protein
MIRRSIMVLAAGAALLAAASGAAQAQTPRNQCFLVSQFENWRGGGERTMYIRVSGNQFYRLEMANNCSELVAPGAMLVNRFRGSSICSPLDWDIKVKEFPGSIAVPCVVKTMTRLSPAEVAALPRKQKP